MKIYYLSFLLIFFCTSCEDDIETQAELTAKKLKNDISKNGANILSVTVSSIYDGSAILRGSSYVIKSDGFIVITENGISTTFNLGELKSYVIYLDLLTLYY